MYIYIYICTYFRNLPKSSQIHFCTFCAYQHVLQGCGGLRRQCRRKSRIVAAVQVAGGRDDTGFHPQMRLDWHLMSSLWLLDFAKLILNCYKDTVGWNCWWEILPHSSALRRTDQAKGAEMPAAAVAWHVYHEGRSWFLRARICWFNN